MAADVDDLCVRVRALGQERDDARAQRSAEARVRVRAERELKETQAELKRLQEAHQRLEMWGRQQRDALEREVSRLQGELRQEREAHQKLRRQAEMQHQRLTEIEKKIGGLMSLADLDASAPRRAPEDASREPSGMVS